MTFLVRIPWLVPVRQVAGAVAPVAMAAAEAVAATWPDATVATPPGVQGSGGTVRARAALVVAPVPEQVVQVVSVRTLPLLIPGLAVAVAAALLVRSAVRVASPPSRASHAEQSAKNSRR